MGRAFHRSFEQTKQKYRILILTRCQHHTTRAGRKISGQLLDPSKRGKAPGHDNLDAELFKAEPEFAAHVIPPLFADKQLPDD